MARLSRAPTGVVTFLFTDIEGSTRMWDELPEAMTGAMARHDEILVSVVERHSGIVFKHTGDGICSAFQSPTDALDAAVAIQDAFRAENFESIGHILVRVAIHTGEAEELGGDYRGPVLNRVARLLDVAVGGDILLSDAAEEVVRATLPRHIALGDLGEHRLRDISEPGHVYFVVSPEKQLTERKLTPWLATVGAVVLVAGAIAVFSLANPPGTVTPEATATTQQPVPTAVTTSEPVATVPDQTPRWVVHPGGDISGLLAAGDVVLAGSRSTGLHGFRAGDATSAWAGAGLVVDLDRPLIEPFGAPVSGDPAVGSGRIFYSTWLGTLHAVDLESGSLLWSHRFERCRDGECAPVVPTSPAVLDDHVVVAAGSDLYRFAAATGGPATRSRGHGPSPGSRFGAGSRCRKIRYGDR